MGECDFQCSLHHDMCQWCRGRKATCLRTHFGWQNPVNMDVNIDMHWRCRGRLQERIRHVDVKVDGYCDDYIWIRCVLAWNDLYVAHSRWPQFCHSLHYQWHHWIEVHAVTPHRYSLNPTLLKPSCSNFAMVMYTKLVGFCTSSQIPYIAHVQGVVGNVLTWYPYLRFPHTLTPPLLHTLWNPIYQSNTVQTILGPCMAVPWLTYTSWSSHA